MQTPESALHGPHAQVPPGPGQEAKCRKEVGYGTVLAGEHVPQPVVASGDECPVSAEHAPYKEKLEVLTFM